MFLPNVKQITQYQLDRILNEEDPDRIVEVLDAHDVTPGDINRYLRELHLFLSNLKRPGSDSDTDVPDDGSGLIYTLKFYGMTYRDYYEFTPIAVWYDMIEFLNVMRAKSMLELMSCMHPAKDAAEKLQRQSMTALERDMALWNSMSFGMALDATEEDNGAAVTTG